MKVIQTTVGLLGGLAPLLAHAHPHSNDMATQAEALKTITTTSTIQATVTQADPRIVPNHAAVAASTKQGDDASPVSGFAKTCPEWSVWDFGNHVWANCRFEGKLLWSRIDIDHMLGNVGGRLVYQKGGYFSSSCVSCGRVEGSQSEFRCSCPDSKGNLHETSVDLNLYLGNMKGFLCSEYQCGVLDGPPSRV